MSIDRWKETKVENALREDRNLYTIKKRNLGKYVILIHFDVELDDGHFIKPRILPSLLSQTPELKQLEYPDRRGIVGQPEELLERQRLSLPHLKTLRVFWVSRSSDKVLGNVSRSRQLSVSPRQDHYCHGSKIGLSAPSLRSERVTFDRCPVDPKA
jgi:hypothetical protein